MRLMAVLLVAALAVATGCVGVDVGAENSAEGQNGSASGSSFTRSENMGQSTGTNRYQWENTGARASYTFSANLGSGSVTVEFLDADGKRVGQETASSPGQTSKSETTAKGKPGTWTIVVTKTAANGQYSLTAHPR